MAENDAVWLAQSNAWGGGISSSTGWRGDSSVSTTAPWPASPCGYSITGSSYVNVSTASLNDITLPPSNIGGTLAAWQAAVKGAYDSAYAVIGLTFPLPTENNGGNTIFYLKEGIERFLITDINNAAGSAKAQSTVQIMWDRFGISGRSKNGFAHIPGGCNLLYMDGHVEFQKYPQSKGVLTAIGAAVGRGT